ncbi:hypothetical protein [Corynebacterium kalidii]
MNDGIIEYPSDGPNTATPLSDNDWIQDMKEEHPDEFARLREHYENDSGIGRRLGRFTDGISCGINNPAETAVKTVQESEFWGDPVGKFVKSVMEGNEQVLQMMMTMWMDMSFDRGFMEGSAEGIRNIVWYLALAGFVINLIIIAARMTWNRRQGTADGLEDVGTMFWNLAFYGLIIPGGIFAAVAAGDTMSTNILSQFGVTDGQQFLEGVNLDESIAGPIPMLFLVGVAFLGTCVQTLALAARTLLLPIIVGLLPFFAGLTATEFGRSTLGSLKNWLIALLAFKPLAAIVYVMAFWISDLPGDDLAWNIIRVLVVAIAGFSVIGVAKIIVPYVSSMGGANAGAVGAMGAAATGAVAAGAMAMTGGALSGAGKGISAMGGKSATGAAKGGSSGGGNGPGSGSAATGAPGGPTGGGGGGGATQAPSTDSTASGAGSGGGGGGAAEAATAAGAGTGSGASSGAGASGSSGASGSRGGRVGNAARRSARGVGAGASAMAGGAKILARASSNAGRAGGYYLPGLQNISDDSLGSAGHPGQISR